MLEKLKTVNEEGRQATIEAIKKLARAAGVNLDDSQSNGGASGSGAAASSGSSEGSAGAEASNAGGASGESSGSNGRKGGLKKCPPGYHSVRVAIVKVVQPLAVHPVGNMSRHSIKYLGQASESRSATSEGTGEDEGEECEEDNSSGEAGAAGAAAGAGAATEQPKE